LILEQEDSMKKSTLIRTFALSLVALVAGCGGFTGPKTSTITGTVLDIDSNPVRDARVWTHDAETRTSSSGTYVLTANRAGELRVRAEIVKNGVTYRGSNWALNFDNEQTQNVNIVVGAVNTLATVRGTVRDRDGFLLENANVFAYNGIGSSVRVFTNANGEYELTELISNFNYTVTASARTYSNDSQDVVLNPQEVRTVHFILGDPGVPGFNAPTNLDAVTWVSPADPGRSPTGGQDPYANFKKKFDPRYRQESFLAGLTRSQGRGLGSSLIVETDLFWDEFQHPELLGFGIYRAPGSTSSLNFLDFSSDPMAPFFVDIGISSDSTYSYGVTSLATLFPDLPNTESDLSNVVVVDTLNELEIVNVTFGPLTFRWLSGSGADEYYVFLFDRFPGVEVDWIWDNQGDPAFGTSYAYTGPGLNPGQTYYYLVLGTANGGASRTISRIGSFQA
jgi:hypothetical protein